METLLIFTPAHKKIANMHQPSQKHCYRVCTVAGQNINSQPSSVLKLNVLPIHLVRGMTSREIGVH